MKLVFPFCFVFSVLMASPANGQDINSKMSYAPTFRLFSLNAQRMMQKLGTPTVSLSQFVGVNPKEPSYRFIVIMGESEKLKKELDFLNKNRFSAAKNRVQWGVLYSDLTMKQRKQGASINPFYPVLDDPYRVVRNRYNFVVPQYCYFIDYNGRLLDQPCNDMSDIKKYLDTFEQASN